MWVATMLHVTSLALQGFKKPHSRCNTKTFHGDSHPMNHLCTLWFEYFKCDGYDMSGERTTTIGL